MYFKNVMYKDNMKKLLFTKFMALTSILSSDSVDKMRNRLPKLKYLNVGS